MPDFLVLGLLDEITCTLASSTAPAIISSNSTRRFLGQAPTVRQIGADLGVQYVVIGSIRTDGQQVVVAVQLVDAGTEQIVWASVYRAELAEALNIRSRIAAAIASAVAPSVHSAELSRVEGAQISDLTPFHLVLRAKDLMFHLSPDTFEAAGELLRSAIGKNPHFAQAHALSAEWFGIRVWQNWSVNPAADRRELITHAQRAVELAPGQGRSMALLGHNLVTMFRRYEEASQLFGRAVSLLPNDSETLIWTVPGLAFLGRSDDAVANAEKAISLSPYDPFQFRNHHFLSVALYAQGDYERAAAFGLACYESNPRYSSNLRMTCASLAAAGRAAEAADVARTHRLVEPEFSVSAHMSRQSFRAQAARERYARHLVEGGLPA